MRPRLVAGALFLCISASSPSAPAFCRTTTSQVPSDFDPAVDGGCWQQGLPLFWRNACVSYDIVQSASRQIPYSEAVNILGLAFTRWTSTVCSSTTAGHGVGRVSIDAHNLGPVTCDKVQYDNTGGPNQHAIIFRDDYWGSCPPPCPQYTDKSNTLALTTVTYDPKTGEILDADMEINTFEHTLSTTPVVPPNAYDFLTVVTHEAGHFLGLAHSADTEATMYWQVSTTPKWYLTPDDIAGICTVYQPDGTRNVAPAAARVGFVHDTSCDPTPMGGFTTQCISAAASHASSGGCGSSSVAPTVATRSGVWVGIFAALAVIAARRKRAR
jgi:hypothetical protein